MNKFKKVLACLLIFTALVGLTGCRLTPIDARTIEEIQGTYKLAEYSSVLGDDEQNLLSAFDFFYIVIAKSGVAFIVYKSAGEDAVSSLEYSYTLQYMSGSTELIDEIKIRFKMPHSTIEEGLTVNYFTVSPNDSLVCQKITYLSEESTKNNRKVVYLSMKHVSRKIDLSYIESATGLDIDTPVSVNSYN